MKATSNFKDTKFIFELWKNIVKNTANTNLAVNLKTILVQFLYLIWQNKK